SSTRRTVSVSGGDASSSQLVTTCAPAAAAASRSAATASARDEVQSATASSFVRASAAASPPSIGSGGSDGSSSASRRPASAGAERAAQAVLDRAEPLLLAVERAVDPAQLAGYLARHLGRRGAHPGGALGRLHPRRVALHQRPVARGLRLGGARLQRLQRLDG